MIYLHLHIIISICFIIAAWKFGDWRNWKIYYPTILFYMLGDFCLNFVLSPHLLWAYQSPFFTHKFIDILWAYTIFPATILLYLPYYPPQKSRQVIYVLAWALFYSGLEWGMHLLGFFSYHHGWNILYTMMFNLTMFPLLKLHQEKPLIVLPLGLIIALILPTLFGIPLHFFK